MKNVFNLSHISAGFTAVLVGYTSSVVIILQMASAAGASDTLTQSWLLVLGIMMGFSSIALSWWYKTPVLAAWSTPGAAMLITSVESYTLPEIMGAFLVTGTMVFLTGFISPLKQLLEKIPTELATAMLAAILLPFCLGAFTAMNTSLLAFAVMFSSFLITKFTMPRYTMPVLLIIAAIMSFVSPHDAAISSFDFALVQPQFIVPALSVNAILNLTVPLYVITMLSQNLPGLTMLKSYGYEAPVKSVLVTTGAVNAMASPLGGFSLNLAAISAAICMTNDVDPDPNQRYKAAIWAGVFYVVAGLFAGAVVNLFLAFPMEITHILAGLALLGTLMICLQSSFKESDCKEPALITFLMTLSGISIMGVNSVLLGLLAGLVYLKVTNYQKKCEINRSHNKVSG